MYRPPALPLFPGLPLSRIGRVIRVMKYTDMSTPVLAARGRTKFRARRFTARDGRR